LLATVAERVLGAQAMAVTADSPSLPRAELAAAVALAEAIGIRHEVIATSEMDDPSYRANTPDRCYHCKHELFGRLQRLAQERELEVVADGSNLDDRGDYRPGARAALELAITHPLQVAGFSKADVRLASKLLGLPTADKPAAACLASRLPYGTEVTVAALARVEASEALLQRLGFSGCRVRLHGEVARIELAPDQMEAALQQREVIAAGLRLAGNQYVTLDLSGYRTGSLNEVLSEVQG